MSRKRSPTAFDNVGGFGVLQPAMIELEVLATEAAQGNLFAGQEGGGRLNASSYWASAGVGAFFAVRFFAVVFFAVFFFGAASGNAR